MWKKGGSGANKDWFNNGKCSLTIKNVCTGILKRWRNVRITVKCIEGELGCDWHGN